MCQYQCLGDGKGVAYWVKVQCRMCCKGCNDVTLVRVGCGWTQLSVAEMWWDAHSNKLW